MNDQPAYGACSVVYHLADGRERHLAAYIPNDKVLQSYIERARKFGLEIEITTIRKND